MNFNSKHFQKLAYKKDQIANFEQNALKDLKIAESAKENEVTLHFAYNAVIKYGIALIAKKGYKVRSMPGHHMKILEALGALTGMDAEIKYLNQFRRKRNIDLYEGGAIITKKEANDLLKITKKILKTKNKGFTLVELIVSVTIASILIVGLSVFFTGSFNSLFKAQNDVNKTQGEFVLNEIMRKKIANVDKKIASDANYLFVLSKLGGKAMPFSYIGKSGEKLVMKDFAIFNDIISSGVFGDSGTGEIKNSGNGKSLSSAVKPPKNFAGFAKINQSGTDTYYVALPFEAKVVACQGGSPPSCTDLITGLVTPIDVETDGTDLFVSDAGTGEVIKYEFSGGGTKTTLAENLDYPAGLAYYSKNGTTKLFVADMLAGRIKSIDLSAISFPTEPTVVAGLGDDPACKGSAKYCQLLYPTGLSLANNELYIADSGNNRILKISDPKSDLASTTINLTLENTDKISRIDFKFPTGTTFAPTTTLSAKYDNADQKGNLEILSRTLKYKFFTTITDASATSCSGGPPPVCKIERLIVQPDTNLFANSDSIAIGTTPETNTVSGVSDDTVYLETKVNSGTYNAGDVIKLNDNFISDKAFEFDLNLSNIQLPDLFNTIEITVYNQEGTLVQTSYATIRKGDDILGTDEDSIEVVVADDKGLNFPTGIAFVDATSDFLYIADTANEEVKKYIINTFTIDNATQALSPASVTDPANLSSFDFTSDFDISSITTSEPNPNKILETVIALPAPDSSTQTFNTKIN